MTSLEALLHQHNDAAWAQVVAQLTPAIHPVDQRATRIWFAFFPVKLNRALAESTDPAETAKKLILKGRYNLTELADSSAEFLYGHRYWPEVKRVVAEYAATAKSSASLVEQIQEAARKVADAVKADVSLVTGITAVAFGTLQQIGLDALKQPAQPGRYGKQWQKSPNQIVTDRAKDDSGGLFGFLKSVDRNFTINYRESEPGCSYQVINLQDVTMAGRKFDREYHTEDARCMPGEGPIPVECRAASCGTCWVGVLSPTEKISPPSEKELGRWRYFGYEGFTGEADSPIRLACQLKAFGNVTLAMPPWNGMIGKLDEKEKTAAKA